MTEGVTGVTGVTGLSSLSHIFLSEAQERAAKWGTERATELSPVTP